VSFVKNILLKYLEFIASGEQEKDAFMLEKVLFTVLKADSKDLAPLKRARSLNNAGLWGYFYDMPNTLVAKPIRTTTRRV